MHFPCTSGQVRVALHTQIRCSTVTEEPALPSMGYKVYTHIFLTHFWHHNINKTKTIRECPKKGYKWRRAWRARIVRSG